MIDLGADLRLARDSEQLVQRLDELVALAAQVRDVEAVVFRRDLAERDELGSLRVEAGRVDER